MNSFIRVYKHLQSAINLLCKTQCTLSLFYFTTKARGGGTAKMIFIDKIFMICYDQFEPISFDIAKTVKSQIPFDLQGYLSYQIKNMR